MIKNITLSEKEAVIDWSGGEKTVHTPDQLHKMCPCRRCFSKNKDEKGEDHSSFVRAEVVGNYALSFDFTEGCSDGIFPFELLQQGELL